MIVEKQMEWNLVGETEVLGENLPHRHFYPSQNIPHDQTRVWTRAAAVGSRRLTAWAMARPAPWDAHTYDFVVLTSLTHPRKIILVLLQIEK
jgi:hypothetical protein